MTDVFRAANSQQRLVSYAYDDRGFRCNKTTYDSTGTETLRTYYVRDAQGSVLANYEESVLTNQPLHRTEVPLYGAGRIGTITHLDDGTDDARYELTDQRGDARVIFHRPTTQTMTEDMELETSQANGFTYTDTYRYNTPNAHSRNFLALLDGLKEPPPMVHTRKVEKGDTITFSVWGLLPQELAPFRTAPAVLLGAAATPAQTTGTDENGKLKYQSKAGQLLSRLSVGLGFALAGSAVRAVAQQRGVYSQAWIKYRVLDEQDQEVEQNTLYLPYAATEWQQLQLGVRVRQGGSIELSAGTSETSSYTYFDDLSVQQTGSLIVQEQHQYAYGAPLPGLSYTAGTKSYRHGYQGQFAEKDPETGWDSFEARTYDARIGRWLSPDPVKRIDSPYTGMGNNPIAFGDSDGRDIIVLNATSGAGGAGHMALLIGNEKTGWKLYSKNGTNWFFGYSGPAPADGHGANQVGKSYKTLEQFYEDNTTFGEDAPQYDRAVRIETTALEDETARQRALGVLKVSYHVLDSSCQTTVQAALTPLHLGFLGITSGVQGYQLPNYNFSELRATLGRLDDPVFSKSFWAVGFGQPHHFTDITPIIRAGVCTALQAHSIKIKCPGFR